MCFVLQYTIINLVGCLLVNHLLICHRFAADECSFGVCVMFFAEIFCKVKMQAMVSL